MQIISQLIHEIKTNWKIEVLARYGIFFECVKDGFFVFN